MKKLLLSSGSVFLLLVVVALFLPAQVVVERSVSVDAYPATVFALVNDFRQINQWSPILEGDPNADIDISGPPRGAGATVTWDGHIIGRGRQTIVASVPHQRVEIQFEFSDQAPATAVFTVSPVDEGSKVTWRQEIYYGFSLVGRYLGLIQDAVVGPEHERGLERLKELAESLPRADFADIEIEQIVVESATIAYLRTTSIPEATAISEAMGEAYFAILRFIDDHGLVDAGAPMSISRTFSGSELVFDAAIPVRGLTSSTPRTSEAVKIGTTYAGPVIRVRHIGPYRTLGRTHDKIAAYLAALGIVRNGDAWESYISDPTRTAESDLLTYVYYPVRL
ncbi:MAG: SRPBCC family protein [Woeseiaceae bacterium]|nr:SRPBCC family protein [Woeseiaceae bacterium]